MIKKINLYFSIHYSFILLFVLSFLFNLFWVFVSYFICLVLHELVHAVVAKRLGYKIGKIKLAATGATLEAESDEFGFSEEIKIAISAPIFNLVLALLFVVFWWLIPESYNFTLDLFVVNLSIFAFNMLPIFPLDGGRVLLAFLSKKVERHVAVKITKTITIVISCLLFLIFILSLFFVPNFSIGIMAVSLFISGTIEDKNAVYKKCFYLSRKYERTKKRGLELRRVYISEELPKYKLLKMLDARFYTIFIIVNEHMQEIGIIKENEIVNSFLKSN
ncbi:MAG: site-2 protease family protein [Clostridia bacterium]|nr:site-2 protease family protein [Clostridia bacterium]